MSELRYYLYAWNDWVVFPAIALVAVYAYAKLRRTSTLLIACGAVTYVGAEIFQRLHQSQIGVLYEMLLAAQILALLVGVGGTIWWWRERRAKRQAMQSNPTIERDARKSGARPSL